MIVSKHFCPFKAIKDEKERERIISESESHDPCHYQHKAVLLFFYWFLESSLICYSVPALSFFFIMSTRLERLANKEANEKHAKILTELLQKAHNKHCADCRRKGLVFLLT